MKTPRLIIGGNIYGCGNIGDDAVLAGILREIRRAIPDAVLCIEAHRGRALPFVRESCEWVDCYDRSAVFAKIRECDIYVVGGGTMIGDELTLQFPLEHLAARVSYAKWHGKKVMFAGVGANRLCKPRGERIARGLLQLADAVSVRDIPSLQVCRELCPERADQFKCDADPAYLLEATPTDRTRFVKNSFCGERKIIGVNVLNEAWGHLDGYKKAIATVCDRLHDEKGIETVFFCNEVRAESYYDLMANLETAAWMQRPHRVLYPHYLSPGEMLDVIGTFDVVLSLRMHALIFAAMQGVPFAGISRIDKVNNFFDQFGQAPVGSVDDASADQIFEGVESAMACWPELQFQVAAVVADLKKRSQGIGTSIAHLVEAPVPEPKSYARELLPYLEDVPLWKIRRERLLRLDYPFINWRTKGMA